MSRALLAASVLLLAPGAPAQATPSLHAAWLREVLDLDVAGAAATYAAIAQDKQAPPLERLVAVARRCELRTHGVGEQVPEQDLAVVPEELRRHFREVQQIGQASPVLELELAAGRGDRDAVRQFFADTDVPQLRPLVLAAVQAAFESSNPSLAERQRQQRSRFPPWSNDSARVLDRIRANDIVRAELDGRTAHAADLRARWFPAWRSQPWPQDAAAAWQRVRHNLGEWQRERQLTRLEEELLRRLEAELAKAAATDPRAALQLLDRMPIYAERLRVGLGR
jgi:hypothetical protein